MTGQHDVDGPDNRAARPGSLVAAPKVQVTAAGPSRSTHPLLALQRAAGNRAVSGYVQRRSADQASPTVATAVPVEAPPSRAGPGPASTSEPPVTGGAGSDRPAPDGGTGGGSAGSPAQPLSLLTGVDSADFVAHLAQAAPASGTALQAEQAALAGQLPSRPAPTGLPVGDARPVPAPTEPAVPPPFPTPRSAADASQADDLARQGGAAVSAAAADAQVAVPQTVSMIHPIETPPALPALDVTPAPAVPRPPAMTAPAGDERVALNASMNTEVHEMTSRALAPALAAGSAHGTEVATARAGAQQSITAAEADSTSQQRAAAAAADAEVSGLHAGWQQEKSAVIASHHEQIQSEAGQTRTEADRTMNEARTQAQAAQPGTSTQRDAEPGLWDRVTSVGSSVVGAVGKLASGAVNLVAGIFQEAKRRVIGMIARLGQVVRDRVDAAVRALREGVRRVGTAISEAIQRGRAVVGRLASALAAAAGRIWQAARQRLTQLWTRLTAVVGRALAAASTIARRIADALGKVRDIVKLLGNKLLGFMAEAVANPEEKVGKPLVALASPFAAGVPGKAEEMGNEKAAGGPATARASAPVQRVVPPGPPGESFKDGVVRHAKAAGNDFLEHWVMNLLKVVASILFFPIAACLELPALWHELVGVFKPEPGGGDRLDHLLGVLRQVVNISGLIVAGVGVWALLIGLVFPPAEPFLGAGYYAISAGVLAADLIVGAAQLTNAYFGAAHATSVQQREMYLGMFSGSLIGAAITIVMVLLGAAAARLAKVFRNLRPQTAGAAAGAGKPVIGLGEPPVVRGEPPVGTGEPPVGTGEPPVGTGEPPVGKGEAIGDPAATDVGAKGGPEPRPREWPYSNPPNMRTVPPGTPLDLQSLNPNTKYLWVVDGEGNFKFAPERQNTSDFMKPLPPDEGFNIKHGDLQPGESGTARGPARAGGELRNIRHADGSPSDMWNINNDSSYTFRRVDAAGEPLPWAPAESVEAVRQHLIAGGTPGEKLVTTDVLAPDRLNRGAR